MPSTQLRFTSTPAQDFLDAAELAAADGSPTYRLRCHWCGSDHLVNPAVGVHVERTGTEPCRGCDDLATLTASLFAPVPEPVMAVAA